ncbi:MAG: zinc ribbon domain-containing protein [Smithella sp.]|nr:zinc ribbon domain-containing protein [Syntrophaceae bacterium]NTW77688.1 zinc ribbon domain-containing protein [Syntrophaceae bacterium]
MPIYEYRCDKCKNEFEVVTISMSEKVKAVCPKCKSRKISKMMSSFGLGKYASSSSGGYDNAGASGGSGCASCTSPDCSSCRH